MSQCDIIENVFLIWKEISCIMILILFVVYIVRSRRVSIIILSVLTLEAIPVISSCIYKGDIQRSLLDMATIMGFCLIIEMEAKNNIKILVKTLTAVLGILLLVNYIFVLIYPHGIPANLYLNNNLNPLYFLTIDNGLSIYILPFFMFMALNLIFSKKRPGVVAVFMMLMCLATLFQVDSVTGIIACVFLCFSIAFWVSSKRAKHHKPGILLVLYCALFITIIVLNQNDIFSFIIQGILGRTATFTGRTILWKESIQMISQSPLIGYGFPLNRSGHLAVWGAYFSSHDFILELLLDGGFFSLTLFLWTFSLAYKALSTNWENATSRLVFFTIYSFLIVFLMESFTNTFVFYGTLVMGFNIGDLLRIRENQNGERYKTAWMPYVLAGDLHDVQQ
jgi:O-antigen ligase